MAIPWPIVQNKYLWQAEPKLEESWSMLPKEHNRVYKALPVREKSYMEGEANVNINIPLPTKNFKFKINHKEKKRMPRHCQSLTISIHHITILLSSKKLKRFKKYLKSFKKF